MSLTEGQIEKSFIEDIENADEAMKGAELFAEEIPMTEETIENTLTDLRRINDNVQSVISTLEQK